MIVKLLKKKSGISSLEAVLGMSIFILFFLLFSSFLSYIIPKVEINRYSEALSSICERQGGLTESDINNFKDLLLNIEYIQKSGKPITVTAVTLDGQNVENVTPLGEIGDDYIKRDSKKIINLSILVPSNSNFINSMASVFGSDEVYDYYVFKTHIISERY